MDQCAHVPATDQSSDGWAGWLEAQGNVFFLYARQQTRSESDAKDVLQDALTEAWRAEKGKIPGKGLVFTIIRRRAIVSMPLEASITMIAVFSGSHCSTRSLTFAGSILSRERSVRVIGSPAIANPTGVSAATKDSQHAVFIGLR